MTRLSTGIFKAALSALHYTGADSLFAPFTAGNGVIFMLHHVTPEPPRDFEPNRILRVTPEFLEGVIHQVRNAGFDIIALDDVPERIKSDNQKPFAVFTLDDGYRDNRDHALPVFKRLNVPFTIYVAAEFADGTGDLWWLTLEKAIRRLSSTSLTIDGAPRTFALITTEEKDAAFDEIYWWLRKLPEDDARAITHQLATEAGFDPIMFCRDLVMTWEELRALTDDPLLTIGAHTCGHYALAKLPEDRLRREMSESRRRIEEELAVPCHHFSYPYGCEASAGDREFALARELGFATAVTTQKGLIHSSHADAMTALPRLSLNGDFQDARYVKVLLSGAPFALWQTLRRMRPEKPQPIAAAS